METGDEGNGLATLLYDGEEFEVPVELLQDVSQTARRRYEVTAVLRCGASIRILVSFRSSQRIFFFLNTRKLFLKKY